MPSPKTTLSLPPCTSTEVSEAQALMHVLNTLKRETGPEAALMIAVDLTRYTGPESYVSVVLPTGKVTKTNRRYYVTTN